MTALPQTKRERYNRRLAGMKTLRQRHEGSWGDIRDFIAPDAYEDPATQQTNDGQRRDSAIVNNTPTLALEIAVSGLFNGTCDPTEKWLGMEAADPELNQMHNVRRYCEDVEDRLLTELARSNYYKLVSEDFRSLLGYGTCATTMQETFDGDALVVFQSCPIGSYYVANNAERSVREFARDLRMSADQMVEKFGDRVSKNVRQAVDAGNGHQEFPVVHIVHRNTGYNPMRAGLSEDLPWRSCYYEPSSSDGKGDDMLEERGFSVFPVACARWNTLGANPWGFGPGRVAVGDSRALQAMEIDSATAVELQIKPPLNVPRGMNGQPVSLIPGSINYSIDAAGDQGIRPLLNVQHDIADARQAITEHEERIRSAFYNDLFLMIANDEGGKMTAREVMERAREKRLALTPILRVIEEYHKPIIAYLFTIAGRRGRLPAPPPELAGQEIRMVMRSTLAAAAELERSQATRSSVSFALQIAAETGDPTHLDSVDIDEAIRDDFRRNGAPAKVLRDPKAVDEMRAQRAEAAAKERQGEAAARAADTAKTLSETDVGGNTALTSVIAGLQQ